MNAFNSRNLYYNHVECTTFMETTLNLNKKKLDIIVRYIHGNCNTLDKRMHMTCTCTTYASFDRHGGVGNDWSEQAVAIARRRHQSCNMHTNDSTQMFTYRYKYIHVGVPCTRACTCTCTSLHIASISNTHVSLNAKTPHKNRLETL